MEVVASLSQGRTVAAQCGLFIHKSVPVIFEPHCTLPSHLRLGIPSSLFPSSFITKIRTHGACPAQDLILNALSNFIEHNRS